MPGQRLLNSAAAPGKPAELLFHLLVLFLTSSFLVNGLNDHAQLLIVFQWPSVIFVGTFTSGTHCDMTCWSEQEREMNLSSLMLDVFC